jgi:ATP-grasp domain
MIRRREYPFLIRPATGAAVRYQERRSRTLSRVRPEAFVLTGSFPVIRRNSLYLSELSRRGLKILVITGAGYRQQATAAIADPSNPASHITEIGFVTGDWRIQGAFVAGAIAHATAWRSRYTIVGAYAVGDTLAEPTGLLCDGLGVRAPGLRASRACRSKYLQRWYAPELSPASLVIPGEERDTVGLAGVTFPAVVKPASRSSSAGVATVDDQAGLRRQLATYEDHEVVLVERKVVGPEFSVESLVQDGRVVFASPTDKETTDSHAHTFVELVHQVPSSRAEVRDALLCANRRLLELLAFENGIAHSEWRIGADGCPVLMEIAARTPGDGLLLLYHLATGEPMEPQIIRIALGEPASYRAPRRYTRQVYLEHEPGVLHDVTVRWPGVAPVWIGDSGVWPEVEPGSADDPPTLRAVLVLKNRGSRLVTLADSDDRAVTFFIDAPTPGDLDVLERRARAAIGLDVRKE